MFGDRSGSEFGYTPAPQDLVSSRDREDWTNYQLLKLAPTMRASAQLHLSVDDAGHIIRSWRETPEVTLPYKGRDIVVVLRGYSGMLHGVNFIHRLKVLHRDVDATAFQTDYIIGPQYDRLPIHEQSVDSKGLPLSASQMSEVEGLLTGVMLQLPHLDSLETTDPIFHSGAIYQN